MSERAKLVIIKNKKHIIIGETVVLIAGNTVIHLISKERGKVTFDDWLKNASTA